MAAALPRSTKSGPKTEGTGARQPKNPSVRARAHERLEPLRESTSRAHIGAQTCTAASGARLTHLQRCLRRARAPSTPHRRRGHLRHPHQQSCGPHGRACATAPKCLLPSRAAAEAKSDVVRHLLGPRQAQAVGEVERPGAPSGRARTRGGEQSAERTARKTTRSCAHRPPERPRDGPLFRRRIAFASRRAGRARQTAARAPRPPPGGRKPSSVRSAAGRAPHEQPGAAPAGQPRKDGVGGTANLPVPPPPRI